MILASEARIKEYTGKGWWGTETLDDIFRRNVARTPEAIAVVDPANRLDITDGEPRRLTYAELDKAVNRLAVLLLENGLKKDDIIAVQLPNSVELVMVYLAAGRLGIVTSPFPVQYRDFEIEQLVNFVEAKAFLTATRINKHAHAEMVAALRPKLPSLKLVMAWGENVPDGVTGLDQLMAEPHDETNLDNYLKELSITANDIFTICWTSGTEGRPKGVPRSHNDWLVPAYGTVDAAELEEGCTVLNPFPLVNMAGIGGMLVPWLLTGGKLVQHHPLSLPVFMKQVAVEQVNYTVAPPALLNMLLQNEALLASADISSIKTIGSGSAPLSPWMVKTWQDKYGIHILNYFGSNEGTTIVSGPQTIADPEKRAQYFPRFGVEGFEWPGRISRCMQTRLFDLQTGEIIQEAGRPGELLIKGAAVFSGYYKSEDLTRRVFDEDGFFHTGDLFEIAGDGDDLRYYLYVGRSKDLIIRGGQNISPEEVETLIQGNPKVAEVAVIGYPDQVMGERVCACVVPRPGQEIIFDELIDFLKDKKIAAFKLPEKLVLMQALPRNPVGKLLKGTLREQFLKESAPSQEVTAQ
jgi:acyl-CoA synthetase (AMP-forming)/AMP-acid ligase II